MSPKSANLVTTTNIPNVDAGSLVDDILDYSKDGDGIWSYNVQF